MNNCKFHQLRAAGSVLAGLSIVLVGACDDTENTRQLVRQASQHIGQAVYYVPGWVAAQESEGLQSLPHQTVAFRYRQCLPGLSPKECDAQSRWRDQRQILTLAAFEPGSIKVLEVSGAAEPGQGPDTSHALIYRCLKKRSCAATDTPGPGTSTIPCPSREACQRAAADLENLVGLARRRDATGTD